MDRATGPLAVIFSNNPETVPFISKFMRIQIVGLISFLVAHAYYQPYNSSALRV